jgi:formate dehydrogenase assembly factor FdhD
MCRLSLLLSLAALVGCAGYQVGNWSLYPADIHTVYVPVFQAATFRRNLAEWVTEAVVKEIENETPFKVVSTPNADSVLTGRIVSENEAVLIRNEFNDPREVQVQVYVEVQWVDRRSNELMHTTVCVPPELVQLQGNGILVPEVGQSLATAEQRAIVQIAQQIVGMMENPW